jgi:Glycosyltransferase family 87
VVGIHHGWSAIYDQDLVAVAQKKLVPSQIAQPFLSPPTDAWLTAPLVPLPYWVAYWTWAVINLAAYSAALLWASTSRGVERWLFAAAAVAPWWVIHAFNLGQVAPLVATGAALGSRLARERREIATGLALSLLYLKPNTAVLVPFALLVAGRYRTFAAWAAVGMLILIVAFVSMGTHGVGAYFSQLLGTLPEGASNLTLEGAFGVTGIAATALRLVIAAATLLVAFRYRSSPAIALAAGMLGSLLVVPYLHGSDLCLFSVAAWVVWEERPSWGWRVPLALGWLISTPYINSTPLAIRLNRWTLFEVALLVAIAAVAFYPTSLRVRTLKGVNASST